MSTYSNLKLALEMAAKVTGREDLAALAGQVQELGPLSDETAAETERLAQTLEGLTQQRDLVAQVASHSRLHAGLSQAGLDTRNKPGCSGSCVRARPRPSGWGAPWCRGHKAPAASRALSAAWWRWPVPGSGSRH